MEGPVRITVTSRSLFDGGAETLHFSGAGTLRPTAAGWDLPYTAACRENGAALSSRIRLTAEPRRPLFAGCPKIFPLDFQFLPFPYQVQLSQ